MKEAKKSVRLSGRALELVEQMEGENFTAKLENLILNYSRQEARRQSCLESLDRRIEAQREYLREIEKALSQCRGIVGDCFKRTIY